MKKGIYMATKQQLTATISYSDGSTKDVTGSASYSSSNEGVATVSASGMVTAVGEGSATITVSAEGVEGTSSVTVNPPEPEALNVEPPEATLDVA